MWIMDVRKGARPFVYTLAKILPSLFKSDMGLYEVYNFTVSLEKESLLHLGQIEEIIWKAVYEVHTGDKPLLYLAE